MTGIPVDTELGVVRLTVRDVIRARAFYQQALGLARVDGPRGAVYLGAPDGRALVALRGDRLAASSSSRQPGLFHVALLLPSRRALAVALLRLARHRVALAGASDHLVSEALYLEDPEGNGIELYRDRDPADWPRDDHGQPRMATLPLDLEQLADELREAPPLPAELAALPPGARVGHVHLQVAELRHSERFYASVLGFGVTAREPQGALFLAAGDYHHHVGLNTWRTAGARPVPAGTAGLASFEVRVGSDAGLADVLDRVAADELAVEHHDGEDGAGVGALVRDPSGNGVLLTR